MSKDEFAKLFKYVSGRFDVVEKKLDDKASQTSMDKLTNTIDGFIARIYHYETEMVARDAQFERLLS